MAQDEVGERCSTHNGSREECSDPDRDWFPQRSICESSRQLAVVRRMYDKLHEAKPWHDGTETFWADKYSAFTPFHYLDGVTLWVSKHDLTPEDDFLGQSVGTVAQEPDGEVGETAD